MNSAEAVRLLNNCYKTNLLDLAQMLGGEPKAHVAKAVACDHQSMILSVNDSKQIRLSFSHTVTRPEHLHAEVVVMGVWADRLRHAE